MPGLLILSFFPLIIISPLFILFAPKRALTSELLPEPRSPNIPSISPFFSLKLILSNPSALRLLTSITTPPIGTCLLGYISFMSLPTIISTSLLESDSFVLRVPTFFPSRSTVTLSVISKISLSLCEIYIIATPFVFKVCIILKRDCVSSSERAAVGSSMTSIFASCEIAFAISTICFSETVRSPIIAFGSSFTFMTVSKSSAFFVMPFQSTTLKGPLTICSPIKIFSVTVRLLMVFNS